MNHATIRSDGEMLVAVGDDAYGMQSLSPIAFDDTYHLSQPISTKELCSREI